MNIYTQRFNSICPHGDQPIVYTLRIETTRIIFVELIQEFARTLEKGYHEDFADKLHREFGGRQTMTAHHHGTDIETIRS